MKNKDIYKIIKKECIEHDTSIRQVAQEMELFPASLYRSLHSNSVKLVTIQSIAEALGCELEIKFVDKDK